MVPWSPFEPRAHSRLEYLLSRIGSKLEARCYNDVLAPKTGDVKTCKRHDFSEKSDPGPMTMSSRHGSSGSLADGLNPPDGRQG